MVSLLNPSVHPVLLLKSPASRTGVSLESVGSTLPLSSADPGVEGSAPPTRRREKGHAGLGEETPVQKFAAARFRPALHTQKRSTLYSLG